MSDDGAGKVAKANRVIEESALVSFGKRLGIAEAAAARAEAKADQAEAAAAEARIDAAQARRSAETVKAALMDLVRKL